MLDANVIEYWWYKTSTDDISTDALLFDINLKTVWNVEFKGIQYHKLWLFLGSYLMITLSFKLASIGQQMKKTASRILFILFA